MFCSRYTPARILDFNSQVVSVLHYSNRAGRAARVTMDIGQTLLNGPEYGRTYARTSAVPWANTGQVVLSVCPAWSMVALTEGRGAGSEALDQSGAPSVNW